MRRPRASPLAINAAVIGAILLRNFVCGGILRVATDRAFDLFSPAKERGSNLSRELTSWSLACSFARTPEQRGCRIAQKFLGLFYIVGNARRKPHIVDRILVARIIDSKARHHLRPKVLAVWKFGFVEFLVEPRRDLPLQDRARDNHDIEAGLAGLEPRLESLV